MGTDPDARGFERSLDSIPDPFAGAVRARPLPGPPPVPRPAPTRARLRAGQAGALLAAVVYQAVCVWKFQAHPGMRGGTLIAFGFAIPAAAGVIALTAATRRGPGGLGEPAPRVIAWCGVALALFVCGTWLNAPHGYVEEPFFHEAARCTALTTLFAAGPAVLAAFAFRHAFASASVARCTALGIAAGALAAATMGIVCADGNAVHVIVTHGLPIYALALIGAAAARRLVTA